KDLPPQLRDWLRGQLMVDGLATEAAEAKVRGLRLSFEPADIVNEVMSFGAPTPVEIAVSGPKLAESRAYAEKVCAELDHIEELRDLQFVQALNYPTVDVHIDREKLGRMGGTIRDVTDSVVAATSSAVTWCSCSGPTPRP